MKNSWSNSPIHAEIEKYGLHDIDTNKQLKINTKDMEISEYIIKDLTSKGYRPKISHWRMYKDNQKTYMLKPVFAQLGKILFDKKLELLNNGGITEVMVVKNGKRLAAQAHCSLKDQFNKKTGIRVAAQRLIEKIEIVDKAG